MSQFFPLTLGLLALVAGAVLGYFARQSIARRDYETIEAKIQKRISQAKEEAESLTNQAKEKAVQLLAKTKKDTEASRYELFQTEKLLLKRESILDKRLSDFESKETDLSQKVEKVREIKESLEEKRKEAEQELERVSGLTKEGAKEELLKNLDQEYQKEILERMRKMESEGEEGLERKAKELLALAIQKCAVSQAQEITTATVNLPSEEIKGRIIGKEGRNIRVFEKITGVEVMIDETPETVVISSFDPLRRQIAKRALEKLVKDGRIQPARIEEIVSQAEKEIASQVKEAGEQAIYQTGILGLDQKLTQLLGRLYFRTSYGQNVLSHSIEVAFLASALAEEIGANSQIAKKAGLLHDIGKAVDHQIEGSHVSIGIKILEKFGVEKEVVNAMKSHHEEYPYESLEAVLVQAADAISGARPGARKDSLEHYLKRLGDLEAIANNFAGVEKSYAIQAGREIRVFVSPEAIGDLQAKRLARDIANRIQEELKYPGEIKVVVIRENRVIEYAR